MKILTGNSNRPLVASIVQYLRMAMGDTEEVILIPAEVGKHGNGEVRVYLGPGDDSDVRHQRVYIIQSTCAPASNLIELLLMIDAANRASADITAVYPFFAYGYQDRKDKPRVPISAKVMARLCAPIGIVDHAICFDLHSPQIQGFFDIGQVDHVYLRRPIVDYLSGRLRRLRRGFVLVAPDLGSSKVSRAYAQRLGIPLAVIDKKHDPVTDEIKAIHVLGASVRGQIACIIDDSIRSGRTTIQAADALMRKGAAEVWVYVVHADFAPQAPRLLSGISCIKEVGVTDTIKLRPSYRESLSRKLRVIPAGPFIGETIRRVHVGESLSSMF